MNQNYNFVRGLFSQVSNARNEEFATKTGTSFKSILLIVVFALFAGITMQGQTYFTESFEGAWYLNGNSSTVATAAGPNAPVGWKQTRVLNDVVSAGSATSGAHDWAQSVFSTSYLSNTPPLVAQAPYGGSPGAAPDGTGVLWFFDGGTSTGNTRRMESPTINLSTSTSPVLTFSYSFAQNSTSLFVVGSLDGGVTWNTLATLASTSTSVFAYTNTSIVLPSAYKIAGAKIGFQKASSWGGYDVFIDNLIVREGVAADAAPINFTATTVTFNATTIGWTDNSTNETGFRLYRSTDNINFVQIGADIASTTTVGIGTTYSSVQALSPGSTYYYRIASVFELESAYLTGSQATLAGATYYWVGTTGGFLSTPANWNTMADGTGTTRATSATTDILIVDGDVFAAGGATTISVDVAASYSIGQLKVTSNTALTLQSSAATTKTITITSGPGDDFVVENGSSLTLNHATNAVAFAFSGTGNTGNIAGTVNLAGSSSNLITTTGGTGTLVTVTSTGVVNMLNTTISLVGSAATLSFLNGSNCNVSGATTGAPPVPLATWETTSNLTISGITSSSTSATNKTQSYGNFIYNCPLATGTMSYFTTASTAVIKGDLIITAAGTATGTGIFKALTSGTLTVNGNVIVTQGRFQSASSSSGLFVVSGNTAVSANGILDINGGTYSQRGTTFTNNGTLTGIAGSARLYFLSNVAQTFAGSGTVLTNIGGLSVDNAGLTITHTSQIHTLRVNLFSGTITGSAKLTLGTGGTSTATTQIGAAGLLIPAGNYDAIPTFNLGTGAYNVSYQQESVARTTGFEIPSSRLISALTLSNSNGLTVSGGALSTGTLTFSALSGGNITTTSTNLLTVTGTATTNIVRTLATAYVNGPLALTLPVSLVTGSNYTFPIGKGTLNPFVLVNPMTGATVGGTVTVQAEVFDAATGGTPGTLMGALNPNRYWAASITAGATNFTDTQIQLFDTTTGLDAIAASTSLTGAYDLVGGVTTNTTPTSLTSNPPKATTLPGFFVMGNKAAATLTNLAITPTGNACTNVVRTVTVTATPGGGAVAGVVINYSINGAAQTPIAMTSTTGNDWSGVIPTVTPANATVAWSVTATDANNLTKNSIGTPYSDEPTLGVTATATASLATVCEGSPTNLSMTINSGSVNITEGFEGVAFPPTGWTILNEGSGNNWITSTTPKSGTKAMQYSYSSLNAANTWMFSPQQQLLAGKTYTISFWYNTGGYAEKLKVTAGTAATTASQTNVIWSNTSLTNTTYAQATATFVAPTSGTYYFAFNCFSAANQYNLYVDDISITGGANIGTPTYSWSDGTTVVGTTNPLTVNPTATTTYTVTATAGGCPIIAAPVTVTTLPLPSTPTAVSTTQCGSIVPLAAVTATSGAAGTGVFKWYAAPTGGVALQTNASTTYLAVVSTTTTFYVSEVGANACESARVPVTITVLTPPTLTLSAGSQAICAGAATTAVTITSTLSDYTNYTWSPSTGVTDTGSGFTFNPTATTTYVLSGSNSVTTCATTANVVVTVNPLPLITSATSSSEPLCVGSSTTLTAVSIPAAPGNATVGTGTTLTLSYGYPTAFDNYNYQVWQQYLFKASELNALGLVAGNINSITFKIAAVNEANEPLTDYNVRIGTTPDNILTGFTTAGLTNVFGPSTVTATVGLNTITFTTPYSWDGFSNIVIDLRQTGDYGNVNATTYYTATGYTSVLYATSSSNNTSFWTSGPTPSTSTKRPNIIFGGQVGNNLTSTADWTWSPATALSATTGNVVVANPTVSTVYTVTAVNPITTCTASRTVSVTVLPLPAVPTATNATQCGTQLSTASVSSNLASPIFVWYAAPTGGVALQTDASTTYLIEISATTTLYVSVSDGSCESPRVPIVMTVTTPPTITITKTVPSFCGTGGATTLTATSADTGMTYSWASLTPSAILDAVTTNASVVATVSETSSFVVTGTATDLTCLPIEAYVSIGVYALPSATVTTDANGVCPGTTANIDSGLSAGNFAVASIPYVATTAPLSSSSLMKNGVAIMPLTGGTLDDGGWSGIPIGFDFNYFGTNFSTISAGTNGLLMFGTPPGYGTVSGQLGQFTFTGPTYFPNTANPANIIALMATDMNMASNTVDGSIKYWTEGYAPNRVFVIQYKKVYGYSANPSATVQCRLFETIGVVEIHILEKTFSNNAIIGLQDATRTIGAVAPGRAGGAWTVTTPEAWRFTPPANYNTIWTATTVNGSSTLASGTNIFTQTVAPAITTTYSISYTNQTTGCANVAGSAQTVMTVLGNTAPVGVNTIASSTSICTGQTVNFSLDYTGSMDGLVLQWQSFDGTSWADIALATTATYSTIPTTATQYRCRIVSCNGTAGYTSTASIVLANAIATTTAATRCGIGTVALEATGNTGTTISWYDAITGGNLVGTGSPFTTPSISANATYYAGAETILPQTVSVGSIATPSSVWTTSSTNGGMIFSTTVANVRINSADIFVSGTGDMIFNLQDSNGVDIASTTLTGLVGSSTALTTVNFPSTFEVPNLGTGYRIICTSLGAGLTWYYQTGAFPYNFPGVSITSGWGFSATSTSLRCIHKLNFTVPTVCSSPRVAVTATVTTPPTIDLSGNPAPICSEQTTAAVTIVGSSVYDTYAWTPASSASGTPGAGWVFNPLVTTTYTLAVSQSTGTAPCATTKSITVTVNPTPSVITIAPTPASACVDTVLPLVATGGTIGSTGSLKIGNDGLNNTTSTPYRAYYGGSKTQALYTAAELSALGLIGGSSISSIGHVILSGVPLVMNDYSVSVGFVTTSTLGTDFIAGATTSVLSNIAFTPSTGAGNIDYPLASPIVWDGVSSLLVETCFNNNNGGGGSTNSLSVESTIVASDLNIYRSQDSTIDVCSNTTLPSSYTRRANLRIFVQGQVATTWSPTTNLYSDAAGTTAYTGGNASTVYFKSSSVAPAVTYTATATSALLCVRTATVPVTVNANTTLALTSANATQTVCAGTAIANIVYTVTNGTGVTATYPAGLSGALVGGTYTISGTPTASGAISVTGTGLCLSSAALSGAITVNPDTTIALASATATATQTVCTGTAISDIVYTVTNGTAVTATYPAGLTGTLAGGTYTISGTPTASGAISVTGTGLCLASAALTGGITVNATAAPTGSATQDSCLGTIADFVVSGDSGAVFIWYATNTSTVAIPLTTQTVLNTNYYVSQIVNGCEGPRLQVTAFGSCLGKEEFDLASFSYYPNPTSDVVNISYSQDLTNVKVFNVIGQQLFSKEVNASSTQIDMSAYANGAYFIQVSTENAMKTVRVIKE